MRRRSKPVSDLPERFERFRLEDWLDEAAEPPPPDWGGDDVASPKEGRFLWHAVRAIRRYSLAKRGWLRERNAPVLETMIEKAQLLRAVRERRDA